MNDEKPVRGFRANCIIFDDEFPWTQELFEEVMAGFVKTDPKPFSKEVIMVSTPKEEKND